MLILSAFNSGMAADIFLGIHRYDLSRDVSHLVCFWRKVLTRCRRNPLTAILQLADGISQSMKGQHEDTAEAYLALLIANVESANTILACAAHQKRIIDDVLILSRLESDMLSFTPVSHSPSSVVHSTIRMFSGEVKMSGVSIEAVRHSSYDDLAIDHTLIDPSRLVCRLRLQD